MTTLYRCGCRTAPHAPSGVLRSVGKCAKHKARQRDPKTLDAAYYEELGVLKGGKLADTAHVAELTEALGEFPVQPSARDATEVGCGASPYVAAIRAAGYVYHGIDPSQWVAEWMWNTHRVDVRCRPIEESYRSQPFDALILAAHVLEHLEDAPGVIVRLAATLRPGGELWIIVPDDSDLFNADHLWFFTPDTLRSCLESAGLVVDRLEVRRYVKHENFIYARARKP